MGTHNYYRPRTAGSKTSQRRSGAGGPSPVEAVGTPAEMQVRRVASARLSWFEVDVVVCSCEHECMKTITLTDQAYKRLKDWKGAEGESFSAVVLKVVPEKGTLGQMVEDLGRMKPLNPSQAKVMEGTVKWGRAPEKSKDRWTS